MPAHELADDRVRIAERRALAHEVLGEVGGRGDVGVGRRLHAVGHERRGGDHPGERGDGEVDLVDRVEQTLLVLLQVAVVRQRQALERGEQAGEVADQAPGLAAGQLGDVGVLLLRQHRRAGGERVVEHGEAELLGRPQHPLLADPREVHAHEREIEQRLGHEVAVAHRVERVVEHLREAEIGGVAGRVDRERGTRQRTGAERRHVEPVDGREQAVDVAGERPPVGHQVVREQDRLRALEVGVARAGRRRRPRSPA